MVKQIKRIYSYFTCVILSYTIMAIWTRHYLIKYARLFARST